MFLPKDVVFISVPDEDGEKQLKERPEASNDEEEEDGASIAKDVTYQEDYLNFKTYKIWHRTAVSNAKNTPKKNITVLLLHGIAFTSQIWKDVGTLQQLALAGYQPLAIDLPNMGVSKTSDTNFEDSFLSDYIMAEKLDKLVILSPSYSGQFSIPYVVTNADKLSGFIPVAPILPEKYNDASSYSSLQIPTLIIYGENDSPGEQTSDILKNIPNSVVQMIPNAGHPAYKDNPKSFNSLVIKFLDNLK